MVQDISKQRRVEDAVRARKQRHRLLADTMLHGVVYQDAQGRIVEMDPAAERILGKTREGLVGSDSVAEEHDTLREDGSTFPGHADAAMLALRTGLQVRGVVMGVCIRSVGKGAGCASTRHLWPCLRHRQNRVW